MLPDILFAPLKTGEEEAAAVAEVLLQPDMEEVEVRVGIADEDIAMLLLPIPLPIPIPIMLPLAPFFPT